MNKINKLTKEINITKIERNIYLLSSILLISTIIINILNLVNLIIFIIQISNLIIISLKLWKKILKY